MISNNYRKNCSFYILYLNNSKISQNKIIPFVIIINKSDEQLKNLLKLKNHINNQTTNLQNILISLYKQNFHYIIYKISRFSNLFFLSINNMGQVRAISFTQKQCGKHVSDTKKRFTWSFEIDGKNYNLQLVNSALSGKRTVLLNMDQIYHQKNLLNIDFDFTHMIDGHSFRIYRTQDNLNKFQLRIDNRTFDQVRLGKHNQYKVSNNAHKYQKKSNDPFADFQNFTTGTSSKQTTSSNAFGDFDFDSFSKPSSISNISVNKVQTSQSNIPKPTGGNLLDLDQMPKKQTIPINDFQTNAFQTKGANLNGFEDFTNSFKQNQNNLLDDQNQFSTNIYANRNHYMDLYNNQIKSDKFLKQGATPVTEQQKQKTLWEAFGQNKQKAGNATKKAMNNAAIKINEIKKSVKSYVGELI